MGTSLALCYLPVDHTAPGTELEVEILGARHSAIVVEAPPLRSFGRQRTVSAAAGP
jgi:glycine cleavage system aminomethyltransferase T